MRVERCFGFVDLCGFTAFTEREGDETTVLVLAEMRTVVREASARRGVRVVKWLGDGAMLSATTVDALVGLVLELRDRLDRSALRRLQVRVGVDVGPVIMFEGDDYIGRAVNRASRLCDAAEPDQVLATAAIVPFVPAWVSVRDVGGLELVGFEACVDAVALDVADAAGGDEVVADPVCGLRIPAAAAVSVPGGDRFCSVACAGIEPGTLAG